MIIIMTMITLTITIILVLIKLAIVIILITTSCKYRQLSGGKYFRDHPRSSLRKVSSTIKALLNINLSRDILLRDFKYSQNSY